MDVYDIFIIICSFVISFTFIYFVIYRCIYLDYLGSNSNNNCDNNYDYSKSIKIIPTNGVEERKRNNNIFKLTLNEYDPYKYFIDLYNKTNKDKDITIVLHSSGCELFLCASISKIILYHNYQSDYKGKINVFIPYYAMSGGTFIAIFANKISMHKYANLSGTDPLININGLVSYKDFKDYKSNEDHYKINLNKISAEKTINIVKKIFAMADEYGHFKCTEEKDKIYERFFSGNFAHDDCVNGLEVKKIGLDIEIYDDIPQKILNVI